MRELANDLKRSGIDVINFAAGELDGDASDLIKKSTKLAIEGCNKYTPTLGMGLKLSLELAGMFIRILLPGERRVALCASIFC